MSKRNWLIIFGVSALVVLLDQLSKSLVLANISVGQIIPVIKGVFNLTLTFNPGVAFGLLAQLPESQRLAALFLSITLALVIVFYLLVRDYRENKIAHVAIAMILGGALGNIVDPARFGQVVDFLDFYYQQYHWPAFNVADSAICVGVTFLVLHSLFARK